MDDDHLTDDERGRLAEAARLTAEGCDLYTEDRFPEVAPLFERALALTESVLGPDHPDVADCLSRVGSVLYAQERYAEAARAFRRAVAIHDACRGPDDPWPVDVLPWLSRALHEERQYDEARACQERLVGLLERRDPPDEAALGDAVCCLGWQVYFVGRYAESEKLFFRAFGLLERAFGPDHPAVAEPLRRISVLYRHRLQDHDPEPFFLREISILERVSAPDDPDLIEAVYRLADHYRALKQYDRAEPLYARAVAVLDATEGKPGRWGWWMRSGYCEYLRETGREDEAAARQAREDRRDSWVEDLRETVARQAALLGPDHPELMESMSRLATALACRKEFDEAEALTRRCLDIHETHTGTENAQYAKLLYNLAGLITGERRRPERDAVLDRAGQIAERAAGRISELFGHVTHRKAWYAEGAGEWTRAEQFYTDALDIFRSACGRESEWHLRVLRSFADFHAARDDLARAEPLLAEAAAVAISIRDRLDDFEEYAVYRQYADVLRRLGRGEEADAWLARVPPDADGA